MGQLGPRGVDLNGQRAIRTDRQLAVSNVFGIIPRGDRLHHQGTGETMPQPDQPGYHDESGSEPPVACSEQPVPATAGGYHCSLAGTRVILYLTFAWDNGSAEIVIRPDGRGHLLTENHRGGRRIDCHFELGFLYSSTRNAPPRPPWLGMKTRYSPSIAFAGAQTSRQSRRICRP